MITSFTPRAFFRVLCTLGVVLSFSTASEAAPNLIGSRHDFQTGTSLNINAGDTRSNGRVCVFCHTPHNGRADLVGAPLWNRNTNAGSYTMYSSSTFDGDDDVNWANDPGPVSLACLSCHDGTIAVGALLNVNAQSAIATPITLDTQGSSLGGITNGLLDGGSVANLTQNLVNTHPIGMSFTYVIGADAASGWKTKASAESAGIKFFDGPGGSDSQVECASCHNPHGTGNPFFLRVTPSGSQLCLSCHDK